MAFRLSPKDDGFYDLFGRVAAYLVAATTELTAMVGAEDDDERKAIAKRIADLEKSADEAAHEVVRRIRSSFITPFDREDLHRLAAGLDDCIDHMDAAADLVKVHRLGSFTPRLGRQVDTLSRMAELTLEAMPRLRSPQDLSDYWIEINRLQNAAAKNHRRLVAEILDSNLEDPIRALRQVRVVDALEAAADAFERVAFTIEGIAVKEA
ncbi:MAG TPA: DUF47 family protein [Phycicoccus sp.]|nr:DUF47 family protein [Phycicoccus sp.]HQY97831.1 DUF47 family protein [Phycicoccus sp.]HRA46277.1 DUF47 family protein [Phycicoccus sp.]